MRQTSVAPASAESVVTSPIPGWRQTAALYRDVRLAKILLIGYISGLPWLFVSVMLTLWLREEGLSRTGIGLFTLMFTVYALNALWAPLVDGIPIPYLTRRLGRRTAWIVTMQTIIVVAVVFVGALPTAQENLWLLALALFVIAVASATQDVAIDALRIELIDTREPRKVGAGSAMATCGWWLGMGGTKVLALPLVQWMQQSGVERAWQVGYVAMLPIIAVTVLLLVFWLRERSAVPRLHDGTSGGLDDHTSIGLLRSTVETLERARHTGTARLVELGARVRAGRIYMAPVVAFVARYGLRIGTALLGVVLLFKIGEAFLGRMSLVFYTDVGFSKNEVGLVSGGLGTVTVCAFAILGSIVTARYGLFRGLVLGGIAMAATNLLFAALAWYPVAWLFAVAVVADQFTTAVSTVAFVAFLSQLCDRDYTATQYAALASLGNLSRTTLAAASGLMVDGLGGHWPLFFGITTLMVLPSLAILLLVRRQLAPLFAGSTTRIV